MRSRAGSVCLGDAPIHAEAIGRSDVLRQTCGYLTQLLSSAKRVRGPERVLVAGRSAPWPGTGVAAAGAGEDLAMLAELRLTPVGARTPFVRLIAELLPILAESSLQYQVHAMGTTLEGDLDAILALVRRCHEELRKHVDRVLVELSVDDRGGAEGELVRSLEHLREISKRPLERLVHEGGI